MKKSLIITGLSLSLVAGLLTSCTQSATAQNGRNREVCRAMVVRYGTVYTQGQSPNTLIGIVVTFVSASPGCPQIPIGADAATAFAVIQDSGLERLPQVIFGEVHFSTPTK